MLKLVPQTSSTAKFLTTLAQSSFATTRQSKRFGRFVRTCEVYLKSHGVVVHLSDIFNRLPFRRAIRSNRSAFSLERSLKIEMSLCIWFDGHSDFAMSTIEFQVRAALLHY